VEFQAARGAILAWLEPVPDEELLRRRVVDGEDWSLQAWLDTYARHDEEHIAQIRDTPRAGA